MSNSQTPQVHEAPCLTVAQDPHMQVAACFMLTVVQDPQVHAAPCLVIPNCPAADGDTAESVKHVLQAQEEA